MSLTQIMATLANYIVVFKVILVFLMLAIVLIMGYSVAVSVKKQYQQAQQLENKALLKNLDYSKVPKSKRWSIIRQILAADAVDPAPNGYMIIDDAGKEVYIRSFTLSKMPKNIDFIKTFSPLLDFPGCTSSIFIDPIDSGTISKKMDKQLDILESEYIANNGYSNTQRKLSGKYRSTEKWAEQVESGDEAFFYVRFLFTLYADNFIALNKISDTFRAKALNKSMDITNAFGVQSEAYLSNLPFNRMVSLSSEFIKSDALPKHLMDSKALSALFNYTDSSFSHKEGIPLGRDYFNQKPFVFDTYDPSHDGFVICVFGKTGSGKSTMIKIFCERYAPQGYRFVAIDSQTRKGMSEGEYATLAAILGGANYQFSARGNVILNPFEVSESIIMVKDSVDSGHEVRTLELSDKITQALNTVRTLAGAKLTAEGTLATYIDRIIIDCITEMYDSFGIYDKQPDSLYEIGKVVINGALTSGRVKKLLPTFTDFYKILLKRNKSNTDTTLREAFKTLIYSLQDNVRELYYSEDSLRWFTADEYNQLDFAVDGKTKVYRGNGTEESVKAIHGVRPYFDGQSTFEISRECPFTNIDISQLPDSERIIARQVAMDFVNEQSIKKNSETISAADKLVAIFDEAHENFEHEYSRKTLANAARTARKRNVALIFSTQTVKEYDRYPETQDILKQAAVKMIFKQDYQDKKYLITTLGITESQADFIVNGIGGNSKNKDDMDKHRGEMCVIDGGRVAFIKVDYLQETEKLSVETNAKELEQVIKVLKVS